MENNLILEGLLSMVTELKERQEKQVTPASREETINRLDVIEQRISEMQGKSGITENMVQEILNQIGSIGKGQSENQKQDLEDIKGLIVTSHRYFKERLKVLFPADDTPTGETTPVSWHDKLIYRVTPYLKPNSAPALLLVYGLPNLSASSLNCSACSFNSLARSNASACFLLRYSKPFTESVRLRMKALSRSRLNFVSSKSRLLPSAFPFIRI